MCLYPHGGTGAQGEVRLVVKADDMGAAHAINLGTIEAYKHGVVTSTDVLVPAPWFMEAVRLLAENPGLDVGVHLCLTSEWEGVVSAGTRSQIPHAPGLRPAPRSRPASRARARRG